MKCTTIPLYLPWESVVTLDASWHYSPLSFMLVIYNSFCMREQWFGSFHSGGPFCGFVCSVWLLVIEFFMSLQRHCDSDVSRSKVRLDVCKAKHFNYQRCPIIQASVKPALVKKPYYVPAQMFLFMHAFTYLLQRVFVF